MFALSHTRRFSQNLFRQSKPKHNVTLKNSLGMASSMFTPSSPEAMGFSRIFLGTFSAYILYKSLPFLYEEELTPFWSPSGQRTEKLVRYDLCDQGIVYRYFEDPEDEPPFPETSRGKMVLRYGEGNYKDGRPLGGGGQGHGHH